MLQISDIKSGTYINGLTPGQSTRIISVMVMGEAISLQGRNDDGSSIDTIIYIQDLEHLSLVDEKLAWSFEADADKYRLTSEAYRIQLAWLFDPMLAVHTSSIEPLPHQITAVYEAMLPRQPLRFILADDPGAGKTIMTGLLLKELILRGDVKRCLIVSPGSLTEQWQEELSSKFHLYFKVLTNADVEASLGNVFDETPFCISRLDKLARSEDLQRRLEQTSWDLIVCDEAHKMSASWFGGDLKKTKRYQLGEMLSGITRHFLLLTATPHNGKNDEFELFLSLIDAERYAQMKPAQRAGLSMNIDYSDIMRRLVKEELVRFDGTPLFPERIAQTLSYELSDDEFQLYEEVTNYVSTQFNRAERVTGKRFNTVGFALTILQRRLASSPEAIYLSLSRRREKLEKKLQSILAGQDKLALARSISEVDWDDIEDMDAEETEANEENLIDLSTAATSVDELKEEIQTLKYLEKRAENIRRSNKDKKWEELSALLNENERMYDESNGIKVREKLIIFTEHRDTLNYLQRKIGAMIGNERIVTIHGAVKRDERHKAEAEFKSNPDITVLIATDAAGEGINLQRAHLMINYDLPWNPNRIEQRFGRIHRIGQRQICYMWNLVAQNTREGAVFQRLFEKLEVERERLGGKVFDILGKVTFNDKPLRELLIDAIQCAETPEHKAYFQKIVDKAFDENKVKALLAERALASDVMTLENVIRIREEMNRLETRKLQPHFIKSFFLQAFSALKGEYRKRANGRMTLSRVPAKIIEEGELLHCIKGISKKYEYICFEHKAIQVDDQPDAELICPGNSLLDAVISLTLKDGMSQLKEGTIFIDETDDGDEPHLLFYVETQMTNAVRRNNLEEVIDKNVSFIRFDSHGNVQNAGYAPYLDYRAPNEAERGLIQAYLKEQNWLTQDIEQKAITYVVTHFLQERYSKIKSERERRYDRIAAEVRTRLCRAINYWDQKANEYEDKIHKKVKNASQNAQIYRERAEKLRIQQNTRLHEIELERQIRLCSPRIIGCALVIPKGMIKTTSEMKDSISAQERKKMELIGMDTVMNIERSLGNIPVDVSKDNLGYDIESRIPENNRIGGTALRFIEVKAREASSDTVTITRNEILTARNCEEMGNYTLAVVMVDGDNIQTTYFEKIHFNEPDPSTTKSEHSIKNLSQQAEMMTFSTSLNKTFSTK